MMNLRGKMEQMGEQGQGMHAYIRDLEADSQRLASELEESL